MHDVRGFLNFGSWRCMCGLFPSSSRSGKSWVANVSSRCGPPWSCPFGSQRDQSWLLSSSPWVSSIGHTASSVRLYKPWLLAATSRHVEIGLSFASGRVVQSWPRRHKVTTPCYWPCDARLLATTTRSFLHGCGTVSARCCDARTLAFSSRCRLPRLFIAGARCMLFGLCFALEGCSPIWELAARHRSDATWIFLVIAGPGLAGLPSVCFGGHESGPAPVIAQHGLLEPFDACSRDRNLWLITPRSWRIQFRLSSLPSWHLPSGCCSLCGLLLQPCLAFAAPELGTAGSPTFCFQFFGLGPVTFGAGPDEDGFVALRQRFRCLRLGSHKLFDLSGGLLELRTHAAASRRCLHGLRATGAE